MFYQGKSGKFWIYADRVCWPMCTLSEQAEDFVQDVARAFELMHEMQDKMIEEKGDQ